MREQLARLGRLRAQFTGTFARYGIKSGWQGRVEETVLLVEIKNKWGIVVADHLWFNLTKGFKDLELKPGDVVKFMGRVTLYEKGYKGNREDEDLPPTERDYRLSYPTKFKKVGPAACIGCDRTGHCVVQVCFLVLPTWCPNREEEKVEKKLATPAGVLDKFMEKGT